MENTYELIIIGAGPAGLSASIYASRYKLNHLVLGAVTGGQMTEIYDIENYPGFPSISGQEIIAKFREHAENFGVKIKNESVVSIKKDGDVFELVTSGNTYKTKTVIMAMGAEYRRINIPGEKEFTGRGVSYCATCDAFFFRNKTVAVVGGGNSAVVVALELADVVAKVYIVYRRKISADPSWMEKMEKNPKIEKVPETQVIEIKGENKVEKIVLDKPFNDKTTLPVDGVFVEIGSEPGVSLATKLGVATDEGNYIKVDDGMATNVHGVFAAGDITSGSNKFRQVVTACSEGAIAANGAYKLLKLK